LSTKYRNTAPRKQVLTDGLTDSICTDNCKTSDLSHGFFSGSKKNNDLLAVDFITNLI